MDCTRFREVAFEWIDGELDESAARSAAEHESACAACARTAAAERAFEARTRAALTVGTPHVDVAALVRAASSRPAGRLHSWRRAVSSLAGVAAVFLGLAWFNCVPPFECSYLQAVERAAFDAPGHALPAPLPSTGYEACVLPPDELRGYVLEDAAAVRVAYSGGAPAVRARYASEGSSVMVVWSEQVGARPSFRRREDHDGREWYVAEEHGRTLVAYLCARTHSLVTVAGELPVEDLLAMATDLREGAPR